MRMQMARQRNVRPHLVNDQLSRLFRHDVHVWHELRLHAQGSGFEVFFNGRSLYTAEDTALVEPGRVALWTKADSVSHFDDLTVTGR